MTVTTRAKANRFREEEFEKLRNIDLEDGVEPGVVITTTGTGEGTRECWVYPPEFEPVRRSATPDGFSDSDLELLNDEDYGVDDEEDQLRQLSISILTESSRQHHDEPSTPKKSKSNSPPPIPSAPKPPSRSYVGLRADTNMRMMIDIKKDEFVEDVVKRHVEMYVRESQSRKRENERRVYEFVKTRPQFLWGLKEEDTELFVRGDSKWDSDPFL